ncbi:PucR family transcriptional regulator [Streptomyces sp. NPDC056697]|uniref:PucR family transcriptional regulator n=1 Tax=Streptomyces sp. NPDC056697 TaxID=3345915 RepID=UPI00369D5FEF
MEARVHTGRLDELLHEVRRQMGRGTGADPRPVLDWLGRQIDADVALVGSAGAVETSTARFPHQILPSLEPTLSRLAGGQMAAAATESGAFQVCLEALGPRAPRPVLVVAGTSAPTREAASLVSHAGSLIALLDQAQDADTTFRGYQHKARQLRFAVFSALLAGDLTLARRMTTGAVPALLDAERLRIHLLHCPSEDRDRLAQTYQDGSGYHGTGLMVHCPAFEEHLICLVADGPEVTQGQGTELRRLVRDNPHYALGISSPYPLGATAEAYGQALHALAAARHTPERVAAYPGSRPASRSSSERRTGSPYRSHAASVNTSSGSASLPEPFRRGAPSCDSFSVHSTSVGSDLAGTSRTRPSTQYAVTRRSASASMTASGPWANRGSVVSATAVVCRDAAFFAPGRRDVDVGLVVATGRTATAGAVAVFSGAVMAVGSDAGLVSTSGAGTS